jgi:diketogulonate reductase-like aldo/keto reductase
MQYKNLGSTNLKISAIGQGATHVGSYAWYDEDKAKERIRGWRMGIEMGMNFIDTADLYGGGLSEELVGQAIKGVREKVVLATKFNPPSDDTSTAVLAAAEGSLNRLGTDYIDLYQVHFPNPSIPIEPMAAALTQLISDGKVRYVGVSNFNMDDLQEMQNIFPPGIVSNQVEYNLIDRSSENEMLPYCRQRNITMIAYSPLGQGNIFLEADSLRCLKTIAEKYQKNISQVILRWFVSKENVVTVTKAANIQHIKENAESADFLMDPDDINIIDNLATPDVTYVSTDKIFMGSPDSRPTYLSLKEALGNSAQLIPSPELLAQTIMRNNYAKPIQLVSYKDPQGIFQYRLAPYDFLGQLRKYWAWIIAYGQKEKIPSYILAKEL